MTALELGLGIFGGFGALEVTKVGLAMFYERQKRNAARRAAHEMMDEVGGYIEKMHNDLMADRAAEEAKAAKRRKPATKKAPVKKPVAKPAVKKTVTAKKGGKK